MAQSNARKTKRKYQPKNESGRIIPLKERKVVKSQQNAGGFYDGMPGVTLDEFGNRKHITFVTTPEGKTTARLFAHPKIIKKSIEDACASNKELKAVVQGAAVDNIFKGGGLFNALLRRGLKIQRRKAHKAFEKKQADLQRIGNERKQEQDGKVQTD
jgi:hypothetical protein